MNRKAGGVFLVEDCDEVRDERKHLVFLSLYMRRPAPCSFLRSFVADSFSVVVD